MCIRDRPYFSQNMKVTDCLAFFEDFYADFDRALACDTVSYTHLDS